MHCLGRQQSVTWPGSSKNWSLRCQVRSPFYTGGRSDRSGRAGSRRCYRSQTAAGPPRAANRDAICRPGPGIAAALEHVGHGRGVGGTACVLRPPIVPGCRSGSDCDRSAAPCAWANKWEKRNNPRGSRRPRPAVQLRRENLRPMIADVVKAQVVGHDHQDVGVRGAGPRWQACGRRECGDRQAAIGRVARSKRRLPEFIVVLHSMANSRRLF